MAKYTKEKQALQHAADYALGQPEEIRARRTAAEETYQNVLNRIGSKGTYETVGGTPDAGTSTDSGVGTAAGTGGGIFKQQDVYKGALKTVKGTVLDPKKAAAAATDSAQGRIVSRMTAEAEQTLAREGPLYDEMVRNTQLPIIESSAQIARQNAEQIKRMAARGGSARRQALEAVTQIRAQEQLNSSRMQQLAQTRNQIDLWARDNAKTTVEFGQNWAANLGGIRESYQSAMDKASELMLDSAIPKAVGVINQIKSMREQAHAENRAKAAAWVKGIVGVASLALGGAAGGFFGAGIAGALGGTVTSSGVTGSLASISGSLASGGLNMLGQSTGIGGFGAQSKPQ